MRFLKLNHFEFEGKRVLIRVDLNSPIIKGKVILNDRFIKHAKTIREIYRKKAKLVILAHQGRPKSDNFVSLKQHSILLRKVLRKKIIFVNDKIGKKAINKIKNLKNGEVLLLENIRFLKDEFKPSINNKLVKKLAPLFDIYINDAFSICHRKQTSIISFAKVLKKGIGRVLENEIKSLDKIQKKKPTIYILAGAKPKENIDLAKKALKNKNVDKILTAGLFGQLCLIAKGHNLGCQNKYFKKMRILKYSRKIRRLLKKHKSKIETPLDLAVKVKNKRKDLNISQFPVKEEIFDIGPKTIKRYTAIIKKARTIFVKGPLGYYQEKKFSKGTKLIFKAITKSKAFSLIGGGDTTTAVDLLNINRNKISYISLSGGALIEYLAGKKLPGLEVLKCIK
jgi:phosphoglycerate kinase